MGQNLKPPSYLNPHGKLAWNQEILPSSHCSDFGLITNNVSNTLHPVFFMLEIFVNLLWELPRGLPQIVESKVTQIAILSQLESKG